MSERLLSPWVAPVVGICAGVAVMGAGWAWAAAVLSQGRDDSLGWGVFSGAVVAIVATMIWYATCSRVPGRFALAIRGSSQKLSRGFRTGAAVFAIPAVPVLLGFVAVNVRSLSDLRENALPAFPMAAALAVAAGIGMAAHDWLSAAPERAAQASPRSFIRQDRRSSLMAALAAGLAAGVAVVPMITLGDVVGQMLSHWPELPFRSGSWLNPQRFSLAKNALKQAGMIGSVVGGTFALIVLLARAWPKFVLARLVLAAQKRLPWRLLSFLDDARNRGLLRQAGGVYQFRHARLQERLVSLGTDADEPADRATGASPATAGGNKAWRRILAAAFVTLIAVPALLAWSGIPPDPIRLVIHDMRDNDQADVLIRLSIEGNYVAPIRLGQSRRVRSFDVPRPGRYFYEVSSETMDRRKRGWVPIRAAGSGYLDIRDSRTLGVWGDTLPDGTLRLILG